MAIMQKLAKITFIIFMIQGFLFVSTNNSSADNKINRFKLGDPNAPVVIYEFVSLACSHCATFNSEILPAIKTDYIDKNLVQIIFIDVPFGPPHNILAHAVLYQAKNISQFELLTSVFFKNQQSWLTSSNPNKDIANFARLAGLTNEEITKAYENVAFHELLKAESMEYLKSLNINGTPSLLITKLNGKLTSSDNIKIEGLEKYANIKKSIDKILNQ